MTRIEIRDELEGIKYLLETAQGRINEAANQECVNPSFRFRLRKAEERIDDALDQMHFAKHEINDLIFLNSDKDK